MAKLFLNGRILPVFLIWVAVPMPLWIWAILAFVI